nr:hypothetical protein [Nanoarchaeum sp.]
MNIPLIRKLDKIIGIPTCLVLSIFSRKTKIRKPKHIAIIKVWALGDSVNSLPAIKSIKDNFPDCKIDIIVSDNNKAVYEGQEFIDKIINFSNKKSLIKLFRKYDLVLDFEPYFKFSTMLSYYLGKQRIGFSNIKSRRNVYTKTVLFDRTKHISKIYFDFVKYLEIEPNYDKLIELKSIEDNTFTKDKIIGICAGSGETAKYTRSWPKERFAELADKIIDKHKIKIVFFGSPKEKNEIESIQKLMKNKSYAYTDDIKKAFYVIKQCNIFISNDTGPMHIAAAQGCKVIGLFGPNTPTIWAPYGKNNVSIFHPNKGQKMIENAKGKFPKNNTSILNITTNEVFEEVEKLIK